MRVGASQKRPTRLDAPLTRWTCRGRTLSNAVVLSRDSYFALAQRARVIRAVFAGHVPESVTVSQAIDARQKSIEHLFGMALACSSEEPELRDARLLAIDSKDNAELARIRQRRMTHSASRARRNCSGGWRDSMCGKHRR